jgi:hypothetical protein
MKYLLSQMLFHGSGLKWRLRRQEGSATHHEPDPREAAKELFAASNPVTRSADLSPGARLLYRTLRCHDDYVICIDPRTLAAELAVSEHKIHCCLNELRRAGMISTRIGNLVFFD